MNEILTELGAAVVILVGVWRIQAHYELRNEAAHAELGRRIDALSGRIDAVSNALSSRIDKVYELLSSRGGS